MTQTTIKDFSVRVAMMLLVMMLTTVTAWATTFSTINVGGTDYALYTGFTATDGTAGALGYANFVDGNTSTQWLVRKNFVNPNAPARDFNGGTEDPAYVEFHADAPIIPKGYVLTYDNTYNENWKPTSWALKAKLNESGEWTTIHSSNSSLGNGSRFEIACNNNGDNQYQYFRFEIYDVESTMQSVLNELQIYAQFTYTLVPARAATCTEYGLTNDGYLRNDGKYFSDENGTNELTVGNGLIDKIAHDGVHHEASDSNIEYWQCSMCHKYFTDAACTQEATADEVFKGIFGTLTAGTNGESGYYTLESKTYTLTEDVNTAGYIYVPEGVTATIDLNGHTIDRGLTNAVQNGYVIYVKGALTLTDSGTGGTVKGGMHDEYTSCVYVPNGGTFTLAGGTLIGNTSNVGNRAVYVAFSAHFIMTGGKITGDVYGIESDGHVTVTGGEISGNTYGIWSKNYSISVSGNPVITNNTSANVQLYLGGASVLTIAGELTEGASIGITPHGTPTASSPVTVTSGYGTYNTASPDTYFTVDNNSFVLGWNENKTEIAVGTALYTVGFDMNGHGDDIDAVSVLSGCKVLEPTAPTADNWFFVGWFTDDACTSQWNFNNAVTSNMTLHALWTQEAFYSFTLPEKMVIVSADHEAVGGKYPVGTVIKFKVSSADYVVDGDVSDGTNTLTPDGDGIYTVTMGDADITITATIKKAVEPNKTLSGSENYEAQNGDVLTGSTSGTVTIAADAKITLSDVTITGGIVCAGTAEITLVGTNSVTGASQKAGIQVGGSSTTLTIKGNGSLTANGGTHSAGIGLSRAWDVDATGGHIIIEGGNITATGNGKGAGIGTGVCWGNTSDKTATLGNITIKGGTVRAIGGTDNDYPSNGIGKGGAYSFGHAVVGTITIYDGIDMVDASSISESIVYMHGESEVTANKSDYFTIIENGNRRIIVQKVTPTIADVHDQTYTGSAITPEPTVIAGSLNLTKGTDYVYSYTNNTNVGTAKVRATFQGDYASLGYVEKEFTIVFDPSDWADNGDGSYTIGSTLGWEVFCDALQDNDTYNRFSGKTVKLGGDIGTAQNPITRMAGSSQHDFTGTFDGDGHTLTVDYIATEQYAAPFRNVESGCVIENLHVTGTIATSSQNAAGIAANQFGTVIIRNCRSSVNIQSSVSGDGTHGGLVAVKGNSNSAHLTIEGCVFDGKIVSTGTGDAATTKCGGFVGWRKDNGSLTIRNSLYAPQDDDNAVTDGATFARNGGTISNCYYTRTLGTAQGLGYSFTTAPINIGTAGEAYSVSGITPYTRGIRYGGRYYMTPEAVSLADNATNDVAAINSYFADVTLSGRTLYKDGAWNTLCLPFDLELSGSVLDGVDVRTLSSTAFTGGKLTLDFTDKGAVTTLEAGKPYLVSWTKPDDYVAYDGTNAAECSDLVSPVFNGVTVSTATANVETDCVDFIGILSPTVLYEDGAEKTNLYMGSANKLYYPTVEGFKLNACRGYFKLKGVVVNGNGNDNGNENAVRSFDINFGDDATGIVEMRDEKGEMRNGHEYEDGGWYTVDGRRLDGKPTRPGVYINSGRQVVIK